MKKKLVKLTESDLHNIVMESVNKVLNEGKMGTAYECLQKAHDYLSDIMNSTFIPFTSPSPTSTEEELRDTIIKAARLIDKSMYLCGKLGYVC